MFFLWEACILYIWYLKHVDQRSIAEQTTAQSLDIVLLQKVKETKADMYWEHSNIISLALWSISLA